MMAVSFALPAGTNGAWRRTQTGYSTATETHPARYAGITAATRVTMATSPAPTVTTSGATTATAVSFWAVGRIARDAELQQTRPDLQSVVARARCRVDFVPVQEDLGRRAAALAALAGSEHPHLPRCARVAFGFGVPEHDRPQLPLGGRDTVVEHGFQNGVHVRDVLAMRAAPPCGPATWQSYRRLGRPPRRLARPTPPQYDDLSTWPAASRTRCATGA